MDGTEEVAEVNGTVNAQEEEEETAEEPEPTYEEEE